MNDLPDWATVEIVEYVDDSEPGCIVPSRVVINGTDVGWIEDGIQVIRRAQRGWGVTPARPAPRQIGRAHV